MLQRYSSVPYKSLQRRQQHIDVCVKRMRRLGSTRAVTCAVLLRVTPVLPLERRRAIQSHTNRNASVPLVQCKKVKAGFFTAVLQDLYLQRANVTITSH